MLLKNVRCPAAPLGYQLIKKVSPRLRVLLRVLLLPAAKIALPVVGTAVPGPLPFAAGNSPVVGIAAAEPVGIAAVRVVLPMAWPLVAPVALAAGPPAAVHSF